MDIRGLTQRFDSISRELPDQKNVNFWFARDLHDPLGYSEWRNFESVIQKAITSCVNSGYDCNDHFVKVNKMVVLGSGVQREIEDFIQTRRVHSEEKALDKQAGKLPRSTDCVD